MSTRRAKASHDEEEHENHERWLVTYADMVTLLMVLFIVMFSMSQVDAAKFNELKQGVDGQVGQGTDLLNAGTGLLPDVGTGTKATPAWDVPVTPAKEVGISPAPMLDSVAAAQALQAARTAAADAAAEGRDLEIAHQKIDAALVANKLQDSVQFTLNERGLIISIISDKVLFELGSAELRPVGLLVLDAIGPTVAGLPNSVSIEGHTDDLPITGRYASNWELSTDRALSVLRYMLTTGLPANHVSASGFADQRPKRANTTPQGRSVNRRVEVVVLARDAASLRAGHPTALPAALVAPALALTPKGH